MAVAARHLDSSGQRHDGRTAGAGSYYWSVAVCAGLALSLALLGIVAYFGYRWLVQRLSRKEEEEEEEPPAAAAPAQHSTDGPSIKISHSLPDIQEEEEASRSKVAPPRQTTLPTVPTRHQTFQRQLSHRLDVPFEVCQRESGPAALGRIRPELYHQAAACEGALQSEEEPGGGAACGKLHFTLRYDSDVEGLVVRILQAQDLPAKDFSGTSDPYIKLYLLPDRKKKFQTRVHRRNLNPQFNETFVFGVSRDQLSSRTLQFSVYDFDRFSRHDLIGHVLVRNLPDLCDDDVQYTADVLGAPQEKVDLGEVMVSLCYLPTAGRLTATVIKARNLKVMDITGSSDPYVKVSLVCGGKRVKKKKTSVKKSTLNPVYNEALVFDVPAENVEDVTLLLKVIDYDRVGSNEAMGCCAIGGGCAGLGREHWIEMLDNPRKPVAQWHALQDSLSAAPKCCISPKAPKCISMR